MPRPRAGVSELYRYSGLGLQFAATIGVLALGGHWLDGWLGSDPWGLIAGVFLGFALGLYSMTKKLPSTRRRDTGREDPERSRDRSR